MQLSRFSTKPYFFHFFAAFGPASIAYKKPRKHINRGRAASRKLPPPHHKRTRPSLVGAQATTTSHYFLASSCSTPPFQKLDDTCVKVQGRLLFSFLVSTRVSLLVARQGNNHLARSPAMRRVYARMFPVPQVARRHANTLSPEAAKTA